MPTGRGRSGINATSYLGVGAVTPPQLFIMKRQPTINDLVEYDLGDLWVMTNPQEVWILTSKSGYTANWVQLYPGAGGGASNFPCDVDTASEAGGVLEIKGMPLKNLNTKGTGNLVEIALNDDVSITGQFSAGDSIYTNKSVFADVDIAAGGVCGAVGNVQSDADVIAKTGMQITDFGAGVVQTDATGSFKSDNGTNGQVLIGGGSAPQWRNLTAGANITINEAPNSITISSTGGGGGGGGSQYAFLAVQNANGGLYCVGPTVPIEQIGSKGAALSVLYDTTGGFYPGDGAGAGCSFTVPVDGKYEFTMAISVDRGSSANAMQPILFFASSSVNYQFNPQGYTATEALPYATSVTFSADLAAADVCTFSIQATTANQNGFHILGIIGGNYRSWITGKLIDSGSAPDISFLARPKATKSFWFQYDGVNYIESATAYSDIYTCNNYYTTLGAYESLDVEYNNGGGFYAGAGDGINGAYFKAPISGNYSFTVCINPTLLEYDGTHFVFGDRSTIGYPAASSDQMFTFFTSLILSTQTYADLTHFDWAATPQTKVFINTPHFKYLYNRSMNAIPITGSSTYRNLIDISLPYTFTVALEKDDIIDIGIYAFKVAPGPKIDDVNQAQLAFARYLNMWVDDAHLPYDTSGNLVTAGQRMTNMAATFWEGHLIST